jgi:hypothetical protein
VVAVVVEVITDVLAVVVEDITEVVEVEVDFSYRSGSGCGGGHTEMVAVLF